MDGISGFCTLRVQSTNLGDNQGKGKKHVSRICFGSCSLKCNQSEDTIGTRISKKISMAWHFSLFSLSFGLFLFGLRISWCNSLWEALAWAQHRNSWNLQRQSRQSYFDCAFLAWLRRTYLGPISDLSRTYVGPMQTYFSLICPYKHCSFHPVRELKRQEVFVLCCSIRLVLAVQVTVLE